MRTTVVVVTSLGLVACSGQPSQQALIRDRLLDYQAAYVEPTLRVPEALSDARIEEALPIPGIEEPTAGLYGGSFTAPRAETAARTIALPEARRYDVRGQQWLAIPQPIAVVWPTLERFASAELQVVGVETTPTGQALQAVVSPQRMTELTAPTQVRFTVTQGLRPSTAELRVIATTGVLSPLATNALLDTFLAFMAEQGDTTRVVSRALAQLDETSRMVVTREEGIDQLTIAASIERVFPVAADILQDLRALIDSGDLSAGTIQFRYVRKATEQRLQTLTFLNRAIATTIEDPVGRYELTVTPTRVGEVTLEISPVSGAASIGGANELIRELLDRLY